MRKKTEARRQAIVDVATQVFREEGFERASMSEICARVGGSKATLYNYFPSKEELFFEVMSVSTEAEFTAVHRALDPTTDDTAEALRRFGERLLALIYSPEVTAVRRLIIAEAGRSSLGRMCYERGAARSEAVMAEFLQEAMNRGRLRPVDPVIASAHLRALLEAELLHAFYFRVGENIDAVRIKAVTARAVEVFMAAYGLP